MSKKTPTTPNRRGDGGGRNLRSYRSQPQASRETTLRALPTPSSSNKKTKKPTKRQKMQPRRPSSEKEQASSSGQNRLSPSGSMEGFSQSRRRSPRLASREAKNESETGSSAGGGGEKKEIPPQSRRRSPRLASNAAIHAKKYGVLGLGGEMKMVEAAAKECERNKRKRSYMRVEEGKEVMSGESEHCCGLEDWTDEQEMALRRAYLLATPSPHFWKKVSKMVPGKSARECFNRIHSTIASPPQLPRSRAKKSNLSPIGNFIFSDKSVDDMKLKVKRAKSSKQKRIVAKKTVRHLLRKHSLADETQEADYFTVLETSPNASTLELPEIRPPETPHCLLTTPGFLLKFNERPSSAHKKLLSRFKTNNTDPSPEVLKRIKNVALHEKYIDRLHCREARRRACPKIAKSIAGRHNSIDNKLEAGVLKAARAALITEAKEAIRHFQYVQAYCLDYDDDDDDGGGATTDNPNADSD